MPKVMFLALTVAGGQGSGRDTDAATCGAMTRALRSQRIYGWTLVPTDFQKGLRIVTKLMSETRHSSSSGQARRGTPDRNLGNTCKPPATATVWPPVLCGGTFLEVRGDT